MALFAGGKLVISTASKPVFFAHGLYRSLKAFTII
jgi:hypothetical protein